MDTRHAHMNMFSFFFYSEPVIREYAHVTRIHTAPTEYLYYSTIIQEYAAWKLQTPIKNPTLVLFFALPPGSAFGLRLLALPAACPSDGRHSRAARRLRLAVVLTAFKEGMWSNRHRHMPHRDPGDGQEPRQ